MTKIPAETGETTGKSENLNQGGKPSLAGESIMRWISI